MKKNVLDLGESEVFANDVLREAVAQILQSCNCHGYIRHVQLKSDSPQTANENYREFEVDGETVAHDYFEPDEPSCQMLGGQLYLEKAEGSWRKGNLRACVVCMGWEHDVFASHKRGRLEVQVRPRDLGIGGRSPLLVEPFWHTRVPPKTLHRALGRKVRIRCSFTVKGLSLFEGRVTHTNDEFLIVDACFATPSAKYDQILEAWLVD